MFTKINRKIVKKILGRESSLRGVERQSNPITLRLPRTLRMLAMTVFALLFFMPVFAYALSQDESIDLAMGTLEGPVFHKILIPYGTQEGAPPFPPYKQQPPAAQQDFRPKVESLPIITPRPEPEPEPEPEPTPPPPPPKYYYPL